ncbi:CsbD family protein [Nocardia sp. NBC_01730]|uniref:microaggregate-binding protein 1 n=1 Tax=Nocardia sp. NBC_01730 TaxID=2975998 RepID=UPI002E0F37B8|nr:CsbD family protein [Nocardia sp. NBC_01730]
MPEHKSGPREAVEGVVEDIKGKTKEAAGVVTGDEDLKKEGRAQQDKAESQRDAAQKEAEAEKARAEADLDEARQSAHQSGKNV